MDLTAPVGTAAVILTIITVSLILFQSIRMIWRIVPSWMKIALGSMLVLGIIILAMT